MLTYTLCVYNIYLYDGNCVYIIYIYMMEIAFIGEKIGMSQIFDENAIRIPITLIKVNNNAVIGMRTKEKNGYSAIIVSDGKVVKEQNRKTSVETIFKAANVEYSRGIKEIIGRLVLYIKVKN